MGTIKGKTKAFSSPLRYPGGKGKFTPFIKKVIEENKLDGGHYIEPFAGGAGVALELLTHGCVSHIHINDIDPAVHAFWKAAVEMTDELCRAIHDVPVTIENWHKQREILADSEQHALIEVALATFFLNRTNRSGILKAGVIGGQKQEGKWKLDVRFNKENLIPRIEKIGSLSSHIHVYNKDAIDLLSDVVPRLPSKAILYLDPPYYVKGRGLYRNFYKHDDHVDIEKALRGVSTPWIVSYDDAPEIREIYSKYRQDSYFLSYTAQEKKKGSEVMIYGPSVKIPCAGPSEA